MESGGVSRSAVEWGAVDGKGVECSRVEDKAQQPLSPARLSSNKNVLETLLFSSEADEKRPFSSRFFAPHHLSSFLPWGLSSRLTSQQPGGPPPPTSQSLPIFFQTSSCLPVCTACRFPLRRGFRCLSGGGVAWGARQAGSPLARGAFRPTPLPFCSLQHVPLP